MLPLKLRLLKLVDRHVASRLLTLTARRLPRPGVSDFHDGNTASIENIPLDPDLIRRLLVIRPGGIGDAALSFPFLTALRASFPVGTIDVLAERRNAGVYQVNDLVRRVYEYDLLSGKGLRAALANRYDLVIDTEQYHRLSTLVSYLTMAPFRCGFDTLGRGRFLTHRARYRETEYEVYSFLHLAEAITGGSFNFNPQLPFIDVASRWTAWVERSILPRTKGLPLVIIVPGTVDPTRIWPIERYTAVTRWLLDHEVAVCLLGGRECTCAASSLERIDPGRILNLVGKTSLPQSCGIMKKASLYLGADCGALHLAVGVGTPTIHMFGSGIQEKWAPVGKNYHLIDKQLTCSPCTRYGFTPPCPYDTACMRAISTEDVIGVLEKALHHGLA